MDMNYDDDDERNLQENGGERDEEEEFNERLRREYNSSEGGDDQVPPPHDDGEEYEYDDDDDEEEVRAQQTDKNILSVLKKLEEISQECGDIVSYKKNTRELFEQLLFKLEENNDQIYSLHHRIKYLEQECESKDIQIEKITIAMQEAVDDCRIEAEELVEEMSKKVTIEMTQRREVERIVHRLQIENNQLKETLRIQTLPGLEKNLDQLIAEIKVQEAQSYRENVQQLQEVIRTKDTEYQTLKAQREGEMMAMVSIVKAAQQKIDLFQHQMKVHAQTLAMYREKEEKAKRSPVIFMHPPAPGSREVFVSESDTLSQESPKNSSVDDQGGTAKKKSFHDNGKSVVPYRKKNPKKKKGNQQKGPAAAGGGAGGGAESVPQETTAAAAGGAGTAGETSQPGTPPVKNPKKKKTSQKKSSVLAQGNESLDSPRMMSGDSGSLSPSASAASLLSSPAAQQSPKTQPPAAVEHREKTSVFWSNIRLSL